MQPDQKSELPDSTTNAKNRADQKAPFSRRPRAVTPAALLRVDSFGCVAPCGRTSRARCSSPQSSTLRTQPVRRHESCLLHFAISHQRALTNATEPNQSSARRCVRHDCCYNWNKSQSSSRAAHTCSLQKSARASDLRLRCIPRSTVRHKQLKSDCRTVDRSISLRLRSDPRD